MGDLILPTAAPRRDIPRAVQITGNVGPARGDRRPLELFLRRATLAITPFGGHKPGSMQPGKFGDHRQMSNDAARHIVTSQEILDSLYKKPGWATLAAETDHILPPYRAFVEASPYVTIATIGPSGPDCSPRGGTAGFVKISDSKTLLIPDRAGNNRIETLRNIVHDARVALHFLIPGCGETLRVKGRAIVSTEPALTTTLAVNSKIPTTVIVVTVERVYFHCAQSIRRANLWDPSRHVPPDQLPRPNAILANIQWRRCRAALFAGAHDGRAEADRA